MKSNPALSVKPPKADFAPTEPFNDEEFEKILWACALFSKNGRYRIVRRTGREYVPWCCSCDIQG
jgi:hypothetical protein